MVEDCFKSFAPKMDDPHDCRNEKSKWFRACRHRSETCEHFTKRSYHNDLVPKICGMCIYWENLIKY